MPQKQQKLYFAAPLFTQAERRWNTELAQTLRNVGFQVILPQEGAERMLSGSEPFDAQALFLKNVQSIREADLVLAIFDGADADSGTCWECGYAYALGRPVIGLRTDFRGGGDDRRHRINLMLSYGCRDVVAATPVKRDDIAWLAVQVEEAIRSLFSALQPSRTPDVAIE